MKTKQEYLLDCLQEECAEVIQIISKIKRFGMDHVWDNHDKNPGLRSNRERLGLELNDLYAVSEYLGDHMLAIDFDPDPKLMDLKRQRVDHFMKYSREVGILEPELEHFL